MSSIKNFRGQRKLNQTRQYPTHESTSQLNVRSSAHYMQGVSLLTASGHMARLESLRVELRGGGTEPGAHPEVKPGGLKSQGELHV